jgi:hypothetical protein
MKKPAHGGLQALLRWFVLSSASAPFSFLASRQQDFLLWSPHRGAFRRHPCVNN